MSFEVLIDEQPKKFIKKLESHIAERILNKVDEIFTTEVVPKGC